MTDRERVVGIIQARMSSRRLPGKVLAPVGAVTMLERLLSQLQGAKEIDSVIVATSTDSSDDELAARLGQRGIPYMRGGLDDVLSRFASAARATDADIVVRLTADCPLHTPDTVDNVVAAFRAANVDYMSNIEPYSRPDGLDVEVFTRTALERAAGEASTGSDREHVTPLLRRASWVRRAHYLHRHGPRGEGLRWTVDNAADLEYVRAVWEKLDALGPGPHLYETVMTAATDVGINTNADIANSGFYRSLLQAADGAKAPARILARSEAILERSARVIPGGAQTYSKSWKQHVRGVSPVFLDRGKGARVWDVDGNEYVDLIQGLLPNILGYAREEVDTAAYERSRLGHSFSLPHPLEVELAERLTRMIPCAETVRFGKNGSDATSGAVRIARAFTKREHVAVCGYHGWQDWYIGSTSRSAGVPDGVRALTHPFPYNDLEALDRVLSSHRDDFAAVIMEPFNFVWPHEGYLEGVRDIAHRHGAVLIFDEICTGFHLGLGGAQTMFGVTPDLATFGKAMGNGYPISCVVGRRDIMQLFDEAFVSFTFAGDVAAFAACLKVLDILEHSDAYPRMTAAGVALRDGARVMADESGLRARFAAAGHPHWLLLQFHGEDGGEDATLRALWIQEVTRRGVLVISTHNICAALGSADVQHVLEAYAGAFAYVGQLVREGAELAQHLDGPVPSPAFRARG